MKTLVFAFMACIILLSCKTKQSGPEKKYVSIASIIRGQVAGVDTSLYSIKRLDIIDSSRTDTAFIHREQFRGLAKDFLELPDIADKDNRDGFREETRFDDMMNTVVITYLPTNPSNSVVQREEILISPNPAGDKVKSIIIDYLLNNRDSIVQKRMLWQVDRSFQVTTMKQIAGQPELIRTMKVVWNEPEENQ